MTTLYGIKNCDTMKKAWTWLDSKKVAYQFHDYKKAGIDKPTLEGWVKNVADPVSSTLLASYQSDAALAQTYVAFAGSADLSTQGSYVRIDGPR
ncbi:MAG: hypothetical protein V4601_01190, partial [Pseudomonadota bacterium]